MSIQPQYAICLRCRIEFPITQRTIGKVLCPKCGDQACLESAENVLHRQKLKLNKYTEVAEVSLSFYQGTQVNWDKYRYPFASCQCGDGSWSSIAVGKTEKLSLDDLFSVETLRSSKVFFHQYGCNDEDAWIFIIKRPDNIYVYFTASCDYTGFDCRGGGDIF